MVLEQSAKDYLIEKGYNPDYGARPLRRAIGNLIEDPLSEMLLSGDIAPNAVVTVSRKDEAENLFFVSEVKPEEPQSDQDGSDEQVQAGSSAT